MSQEKLGEALGVTFQQVQKYERGANRIGASRLFYVARALDVPIEYFFEGFTGDLGELDGGVRAAKADEGDAAISAFLSSPAGLRIATSFARIEDSAVREKIAALVATLAEKGEAE